MAQLVQEGDLRWLRRGRLACGNYVNIRTAQNTADFNHICENREGGFTSFTDSFCYLGSIITPNLLSDDDDIRRRIQLASKAFGSLRTESFCSQSIGPIILTRFCNLPP